MAPPEPVPDAFAPAPDADLAAPDAEVPADATAQDVSFAPDAAAPEVAPPPEADAGPPPTPVAPGLPALAPVACGGIPAFEAEFVETAPDHYETVVTPGVQHSAETRCGGRGPDVLLGFTAPAAGEWTFAADTGGAFPWVVAVRDVCDDPESERACALMPGAGLDISTDEDAGAAHVRLEAGERVYLVADTEHRFAGCGVAGFGGGCGWAEVHALPMTLLATRADAPAPPALVSAAATRRPGQSLVIDVEVADADADAVAVEVTGTDAHGAPAFAGQRPLVARWIGVSRLPGRAASGGRVVLRDTLAARLSLVAVDASGGRSAPVEIEPGPRPFEGVGDACDASLPGELSCADGGTCMVRDGAGVCVGAEAPTLRSVRVLRDADTLLVEVEGTDPNGYDMPTTHVELLAEADDTPLPVGPAGTTRLIGRQIEEAWGGLQNWPRARLYSLSAEGVPFEQAWAPAATRARVWWVDTSGLPSEARVVELSAPTARTAGEGCRADGLGGACVEGTTCVLYAFYGVPSCEDPRSAVIRHAEAGRAPDGRLTLAVEVAEGAHPLEHVAIERLDARGEVVAPPASAITSLNTDDGVFVDGVWYFALRTGLDLDAEPETAGLRLTPYQGTVSQPLESTDVPIVPLVPKPAGAECDPLAVRSVCEGDLVCPGATRRCARP